MSIVGSEKTLGIRVLGWVVHYVHMQHDERIRKTDSSTFVCGQIDCLHTISLSVLKNYDYSSSTDLSEWFEHRIMHGHRRGQ